MTDLTPEALEQVKALLAKATPGPWEEDCDPFDGQGYATCVFLPDRSGQTGTQIARFDHNWNEAAAGERRISWKEAETNTALIVTLRNLAPAMIAEIERLRVALELYGLHLSSCEVTKAKGQEMLERAICTCGLRAAREEIRQALGDKPC